MNERLREEGDSRAMFERRGQLNEKGRFIDPVRAPPPPPPPQYSVFSYGMLSFRLDIGQDPGKGNVHVITAQQFYMCLQFVTEKPLQGSVNNINNNENGERKHCLV